MKKLKTLVLGLCILFFSCEKDDATNEDLTYKIEEKKVFEPNGTNAIQLLTYTSKENGTDKGFEFYSHGIWYEDPNTNELASYVYSYSIGEYNSDNLLVTIPNEGGNGIGYFYSTTKSGEKSPYVFELKEIDANSLYIHQYEMNWDNYDANLINSSKVVNNGGDDWSETELKSVKNKLSDSKELQVNLRDNLNFGISPKNFAEVRYESSSFKFLFGGIIKTTIGIIALGTPGLNILTVLASALIINGNLDIIDFLKTNFDDSGIKETLIDFGKDVLFDLIGFIHEATAPTTYTDFSAGINLIEVWDHGSIDGDIVHIEVNNTRIASNVYLTAQPKTFYPNFIEGRNHVKLIIVNEGQVSPCTAQLKIKQISRSISGLVGSKLSVFVYAK
jgi:hypothetical protein